MEENENKEEIIDWQDRYIRLAADFDNFRKNKIIEIENIKKTANKDLMIDLLPVVDAIMLAERNNEQMTEGVKNIFKMLTTTLTNRGLARYGKTGDKFNEAIYDAVSLTYNEGTVPGIITEIVKYGYTLNDAIIRHAQVVVSN